MISKKMTILFFIITMLAVIVVTGCGTKKEEPVVTDLENGNDLSNAISQSISQVDEDLVYECTQQEFSFHYEEGNTPEWNDNTGVNLYIEKVGELPYLQIYRSTDSFADFDSKAYFDALVSQVSEAYGENLVSKTQYESYNVGDKKLEGGASFQYRTDPYDVEMLIVTDIMEDSVVQYVCRYYVGQQEAAIRALEKAVSSYKAGLDMEREENQEGGVILLPGGVNEEEQLGNDGETAGQQQETLNLVEYDGGFFTLMLPEGWQILTMGQYTTFGFRAYDPQNPDYEIFYYGDLGPLNKSYEAKNGWGNYLNNMGYPNAAVYYDAPVISTDSASSIFYVFDELQAVSDKYGFGFSLPALSDILPQLSMPIESPFSQQTVGDSMMFAGVRGSNGGACAGMFMASLWKTSTYYVDGVDMMPTSATYVTGVVAPAEDFINVENVLTQAVFSLRFTQQYITDGVAYSQAVGQAAMADNAARQAVFDKANKAWSTYFRGSGSGSGTFDSGKLNELNDLLDDIQDTLR